MKKEELIKKVRELKELKVMSEELQGEIEALENSIKGEMVAQNVNEMQVDVFKIRWTKVLSNRFDTKAFRNLYADLYNQFIKQTETMRFSIV